VWRVLAHIEVPTIENFNQQSQTHVRASRRDAPEDLPGNSSPSQAEGARECRVPVHPQPRVRRVAKHAHEYSQRVHRINPAFPHAMALQLMSCSSRRSGLFATVASPISDLSAPGRADKPSARLDTSVEVPEPHDFAVREMRRSSGVLVDRSQVMTPALQFLNSRPTLPASTASRPAFVTIAKRPSSGTRRREL
jgi:hypothetical protein